MSWWESDWFLIVVAVLVVTAAIVITVVLVASGADSSSPTLAGTPVTSVLDEDSDETTDDEETSAVQQFYRITGADPVVMWNEPTWDGRSVMNTGEGHYIAQGQGNVVVGSLDTAQGDSGRVGNISDVASSLNNNFYRGFQGRANLIVAGNYICDLTTLAKTDIPEQQMLQYPDEGGYGVLDRGLLPNASGIVDFSLVNNEWVPGEKLNEGDFGFFRSISYGRWLIGRMRMAGGGSVPDSNAIVLERTNDSWVRHSNISFVTAQDSSKEYYEDVGINWRGTHAFVANGLTTVANVDLYSRAGNSSADEWSYATSYTPSVAEPVNSVRWYEDQAIIVLRDGSIDVVQVDLDTDSVSSVLQWNSGDLDFRAYAVHHPYRSSSTPGANLSVMLNMGGGTYRIDLQTSSTPTTRV